LIHEPSIFDNNPQLFSLFYRVCLVDFSLVDLLRNIWINWHIFDKMEKNICEK